MLFFLSFTLFSFPPEIWRSVTIFSTFFCTFLWITCPCVVLLLHSLVIELFLLSHVFLVSCFRPTLFSRTNSFIHWVPCMSYWICWHCKRLSQVYIPQVGHQILCLFSYSYIYISLILLDFKFKLYSSLNHISGSWLVSLILKFAHFLVTSFRLFCFSSDTSYFSMSVLHASCVL